MVNTLSEIGERQLVEIVKKSVQKSPRVVIPIGDDCGGISLNGDGLVLVATTDPCPTPLARVIGYSADYFDFGWYSAVINLSDIASMGAKPLSLLVAVRAPNDMKLSELKRFYAGLGKACKQFACPLIGGDFQDGPRFEVVGSALGIGQRGRMLLRRNALPGDVVVVIGELSLFWACALSLMKGLTIEKMSKSLIHRVLLHPLPRLEMGINLAKQGLARCAMDASDGLTVTFKELAKASKVDFFISFEGVQVHPVVTEVANILRVNPWNLLRGWGDWQLVVTMQKQNVPKAKKLAQRLRCPFHEVGQVKEGSGKVFFVNNGQVAPMNIIESERFTGTSYFTNPIEEYVSRLLNTELCAD